MQTVRHVRAHTHTLIGVRARVRVHMYENEWKKCNTHRKNISIAHAQYWIQQRPLPQWYMPRKQ